MRDKILSGTLLLDEYDHLDIFDFVKLLKRNNYQGNEPFIPISIDKWTKVIKQAKKRSTSSIFLLR